MHRLGTLRQWRPRWFVLREGTLSCWDHESDAKPKQVIILNEACKFGPSDERIQGKTCFQISSWDGTVSLYTETEQEMEEWKAYVQAHVDAIKSIFQRADPPVLRGVLHKRGEWGKWSRRWFVVKEHYLQYYHSPENQRQGEAPVEFDLRGAVLSTSTQQLSRPDSHQLGTLQALADEWSDETVSAIQRGVEFFNDGRVAQLCFSLVCCERHSGRKRTLNLSAENQPEFDEWIKSLLPKIQEQPISGQFLLSDHDIECGGQDRPGSEFEQVLQRSQIRNVCITPDLDCGVSDNATHEESTRDVMFLVTVEHQHVQWQVQQPYARFLELHQFFADEAPDLHVLLDQHTPPGWPTRPIEKEHNTCARHLQRYFETALANVKKVHQSELAKIISPVVGKLRFMQGRLHVRRRRQEHPPQTIRWCKVEVHPCSYEERKKSAEFFLSQALSANKCQDYKRAAKLYYRAAGLFQSIEYNEAESSDEHSTCHDLARVSSVHLIDAADSARDRAKRADPNFSCRGLDSPEYTALGPCFSWSLGPDTCDYWTSSAVLKSADGASLRVPRGLPDDEWPLELFRLETVFLRTEPG